MHDLDGPEVEAARRRRLDELFADQPFVTTAIRTACLPARHERMVDEPPPLLVPVLGEIAADDVILRLQHSREQRQHAITLDLEDLRIPVGQPAPLRLRVEDALTPTSESPRPRTPYKRQSAAQPTVVADTDIASHPMRIELLVDNSASPPRIIAHAEQVEHTASVLEVMTVREAATFLRIGVGTLRALVKTEAVPHSRFGRQLRFRREALLAWLAEREERGRLQTE